MGSFPASDPVSIRGRRDVRGAARMTSTARTRKYRERQREGMRTYRTKADEVDAMGLSKWVFLRRLSASGPILKISGHGKRLGCF